MSKIGRNDPCPCGSGKKYKKCCMEKVEVQRRYNDAKQNLLSKLVDFFLEDRFAEQADELAADYIAIMGIEDKNEVDEDDYGNLLSVGLFDAPMEGSSRLVEIFYKEKGEHLPSQEREILENMLDMTIGIYEVQDYGSGNGFLVENLMEKERFHVVVDEEGMQVIKKWDIIIARVLKIGHENQIMGAVVVLPSASKKRLLEFVYAWLADYRKHNKKASINEFLRNCALEILASAKDAYYLGNQNQVMVNRDGNMVEICSARYSINNISFIKQALQSHPNIQLDSSQKDRCTLSWISDTPFEEAGVLQRTILGTIILEKDSLLLQTNSRNRLEKGKQLIQKLLGIAAKHEKDTIESVEEFLKRNQEELKDTKSAAPSPEIKKIERTFLENHYKQWIDMPLPGLGGRTPREASRIPQYRRKLVELFKQLEQSAIMLAKERGFDPINLDEIRRILNLDEPCDSGQPEDEVEQLLMQNMKEYYTPWQIEEAVEIWRDFKKQHKSIRGKPEGWAAGVEYFINQFGFIYMTQTEIGDRYGISASTVGKRYREIADELMGYGEVDEKEMPVEEERISRQSSKCGAVGKEKILDKENGKVYQFKITLKGIRPPIWRRFQVKSGITFHELHKTIQVVMGWHDYHLYCFTFGRGWDELRIEEPDEYGGFTIEGENLDSRKTRVDAVFTSEKEKCLYEYDFGDGWEHELLLEKILEPEGGVEYPVCIKGRRACPPEDCGGVYGYYELIEIINNPRHPEYEGTMEWLGGDFDPEEFDLEEVNQLLEGMENSM